MGIGLSGMISGLDTDSIVKAMVSAQQTKATKIENKITLNKWTTEAWSSLNTKIYSFYTKYASKLRLQSSYMTRTAKSSNESAVTATAGSTAAVGTHSLQIKQLASSQYVTGAKLGKADTYNKNSKLTEMTGLTGSGVTAGTVITITGNKGTDDETVTKLEVTESTTVNDFLNACKEAGLTATFDTTQQRFFISSSQSGADDAFSITTSTLSPDAANAFANVEAQVDTSLLSSAEQTTYNAALSTLRQNLDVISTVLSDAYNESDSTQKAVYDAINTVKEAAAKKTENQINTESEAAAISEEDDIITGLLADAVADPDATLGYGSTELTFNKLYESAFNKVTAENEATAVQAGKDAISGLTIIKEDGKSYADLSDVTAETYAAAQNTIANATVAEDEIDAALEAGTIDQDTADELKAAYATVNTWEAEYEVTDEDGNVTTATVADTYTAAYEASVATTNATREEDIVAEMQAQLKADQQETYDANVAANAAAKAEARAAELETTKEAVETNLLAAATAGTAATASSLSALGLGEIDGSTVSDGGSNGMAVVAASNAVFVLDGATMEETSNSFTVNGITLNLSATTFNKDTGDYDSVQITVGKDSDSTYKLIKEALTEYNTLIEEMNTLYSADSARDYDPLTDEQKEAMSETEIEDWENKIKSSLLRRDNTLGTLLSSMRTALSSTYTDEDGKTYSLSTYGIVTGNYTENGKLHIYGDEDDSTYATYTDRLKAALEEDPDKVMEVLTNVFGKLYTTMTEKCAKTEISSALTFYNDKQYSSLLSDYEDDLDIMEDRIADLEDKYYKQFTAMETALSKLQSQQNSLASLLGTSTQ